MLDTSNPAAMIILAVIVLVMLRCSWLAFTEGW
jgi:hypothetical protein